MVAAFGQVPRSAFEARRAAFQQWNLTMAELGRDARELVGATLGNRFEVAS
jgi:hypothetical protein